jgi:putative transposase
MTSGLSTHPTGRIDLRTPLLRALRAGPRGHFPNEQAALKCVYMAVMSLDPTGAGRKHWTMRWKPALNAFDLAFDGRLAAGRK